MSWITVHGRTINERASPVNMEAIRIIKDSVRVPVVANGDVTCLQDIDKYQQLTGVDGEQVEERNLVIILILVVMS